MELTHPPKLILGLGNPGEEYANTYHNAGHLFIDYLENFLEKEGIGPRRSSKTVSCFKSGAGLICKSEVFMNLSGVALKDALKIKKVKPEEILIVHDESDLTIGSYKFSFDRNSAGHKGIDSIIKSLGFKNFWRLRVGIRPVENRTENALPALRAKAGDFVLKKISKTDQKILYGEFAGVIEKLILKETP